MLFYTIIVTTIVVILTIIVTKEYLRRPNLYSERNIRMQASEYESETETEFLEHLYKEHTANQDKGIMK